MSIANMTLKVGIMNIQKDSFMYIRFDISNNSLGMRSISIDQIDRLNINHTFDFDNYYAMMDKYMN